MRLHLGTLLLSMLISLALWGMAHGTSSIERSVDVPIVFHDVSDSVVITGQSTNEVNVRVLGSRAALRNMSQARIEFPLSLQDAQPGTAIFEVDESLIELPRGARIVSRSPANVEVSVEIKGRKALKVIANVDGDPAPGYAVGRVEVVPRRVWITGAHSEVVRLSEVATETIDMSGATEAVERRVRVSLRSEHVWPEEDVPVVVRVEVDELPEPSAPNPAGDPQA